MLWVKTFHVIFMVTWFAGLFYLPRLFVYHAMTEDKATQEKFKVMERKLYVMTNIGMGFTTLLGLWMLFSYAWTAYSGMGWLHVKLTLVVLLLAYHFFCGKLVRDFRDDKNTRSHKWYRFFNEVPVIFLLGIIILVKVKPF